MHEREWHTDIQTDTAWRHRPRLYIASRGNKYHFKTSSRSSGAPPICTYTWDFPDVKFRVATQLAGSLCKAAKFRSLYDIGESNPVRHPDFDPDRAQKLISSSMSRHLSTRNIWSKSMHAFLSNLANRQTDRQTDRQTNKHWEKHVPSAFVGGKKAFTNVCGCRESYAPAHEPCDQFDSLTTHLTHVPLSALIYFVSNICLKLQSILTALTISTTVIVN